jgi:hypothetical protein
MLLAAGWPYWEAVQLALEVVAVDKNQGTDPASAHKHGMGGREEHCQEAYDNILNEFNVWDLATQLHAVEDSYALGHQYKPWNGIPTPYHFWDDFDYIPVAEGAAQNLHTALGEDPSRNLAPKPKDCN